VSLPPEHARIGLRRQEKSAKTLRARTNNGQDRSHEGPKDAIRIAANDVGKHRRLKRLFWA
jgi:hypothetical protein